jgi:hypothetical protein
MLFCRRPYTVLWLTDGQSTSSIHEDNNQANRKPSTIKKLYDISHHLWIAVIAAGLFAQMFRSSNMTPRVARLLGALM